MELTFEKLVLILQSTRLNNVRLHLFLTRLNAQNVKYTTGPLRVRFLISLANIRNTA